MTWHSLPVFVRVAGRPVILVGEGEAADAKRRLLERAGAVVVADHPDARLAVVAVEDGDEAVAAVARLRARGLLVNAVDRPALCDFTLPAIVDRHPVLVAIGTGGVSAGLAAALRQRLEGLMPAGLGALADALFAARDRLRRRFPDGGERRRAIATGLRGAIDPLSTGAAERVEAWIDEPVPSPTDEKERVATSPVLRAEGALVRLMLPSRNADDLTLGQARQLANADLVVHAVDVPAAILNRARADAARIAWDGSPLGGASGLTVFVQMAS